MGNGSFGDDFEPLRRLVESPAFTYYPHLQRVRSHLTTNLADPLSLAEAARIAGYERCYFSSYFRRRVNLRFSDWVSGLRVSRATQLIASRDCNLSWVSDQVGFANQRAFQRAFKKWTGMTAREFRLEARKAARSGDASWPRFREDSSTEAGRPTGRPVRRSPRRAPRRADTRSDS